MAKFTRSEARRHRCRELDDLLAPDGRADAATVLAWGWVAAVRTALGTTQSQLAAHLGVTRASVNKLEKREVSGGATLGALRRAAEALGCELHYRLVPRGGSFRGLLGDQADRADQPDKTAKADQVAARMVHAGTAPPGSALQLAPYPLEELVQRPPMEAPRSPWSEAIPPRPPNAPRGQRDHPRGGATEEVQDGRHRPQLREATPEPRDQSSRTTSTKRVPPDTEQLDAFGF